ncbi:MFS transporter [Actinobacteria bacterium YIM 96077]|uniref:MFS transporter n=1 Tax=Phytoactinopolyspora halophila TaxID=1981511 RepID=A0A329QHI3_9ACTN|nr:MFS transporter [Phytoactinopolyspora halophila]AYY13635.1 MFS transporter [Actinobacteria bacterium YIM 96077]RAW11199.1 MFS transporter [Phytoactinopolyspora halophila]
MTSAATSGAGSPGSPGTSPGPLRGRGAHVLAIAAIALMSLNLRPAANSLGAVIPAIREDLGLSATAAGILNATPGLCFVVFGLAAPTVGARLGVQRTLVLALIAMVTGQLIRVSVPAVGIVFAGSVTALAGMAMGNILLPGLVRTLFPRHVPAITGMYTACMLGGATAASGLTVPIGRGLDGDWRAGMGSWALLTVLALIPWIGMLVTTRTERRRQPTTTLRLRTLLRNRVAWSMALLFAMQSMQAYVVTGWLSQILVDAGMDLAVAGSAVAVFVAAGLPLATVIPPLARRERRIPVLIVSLGVSYLIGYTGLLLWPAQGAWAWAVVIGMGGGTFPLMLMMITLRARTLAGLTALSAFAQCIGYTMAMIGPFVFGILHDLSGAWTVPILTLMASVVVMVIAGLHAARPRMLEDAGGRSP